LAFVDFPINPLEGSLTIDEIVIELPFIDTSVTKCKYSLALFLSFVKSSFKDYLVVSIDLNTLTMRMIVLPLAFIDCTICLYKIALTISKIVFPITFINTAIGIELLAITISLIILPIAYVLRPISPLEGSIAMSLQIRIPVSYINRLVVKIDPILFTLNHILLKGLYILLAFGYTSILLRLF
jgi:hypothetical protein